MDPLSASVDESRTDLLPSSSAALFEQFLNERCYLKNVTADTIDWYEAALKAFRRTLNDGAAHHEDHATELRREDAPEQREARLSQSR